MTDDWADPDRRDQAQDRLLARLARTPLVRERDIDLLLRSGLEPGLPPLTVQVLQAAAAGLDARATADVYGMAYETARLHRRRAILELGAKNMCHAVAIALRQRLIV